MSTVQYGSTYLGYALNKSSEWNSGYAAQGAAKNGQPRDGLMLYGGLRSSVNWADQSVTEVRLYLDFGTAGASARKYIGLYASSRNSAGGVGSAVRGTYFGQFQTSSTTYGAKETVTFNAMTNASVFAGLKNWIENGTTVGLVMFMNESNSSSYSTNFLNVDGSNIQIDYELKGSKGSITPDPADIGSDVTLHIDAVTASQTVTHTAEFELGSVSSGVIQLAEGVTDYTYTLPMSWLGQLASGASSAAATCTLSTYIGGSLTGTRVISFTAQVPSAYAPQISAFTVERYSSYVDDQGHTQYKPDLMGGYVWVSLTAQMDTSSGLTPDLEIQYWPNDDDTDVTTVPITWAGSGTPSTMTLTNDRSIITAAVPIANAYVFQLTFSNGHQTATARSLVQKSWAAFHVAGSGYGVGVGMFSPGTQAEPSFDVAWPMNGNGGANIANLNSYSSGEQFTGGYWIDGKPIYRYVMASTVSGTGDKTLGDLPSTPDHVIRMYGEFIHESNSHRPIAFTSYGGIAWSLSPIVLTKAVHLYIGSNFNNPNTHSYILVLEYTKA
ncbi:MAG: hypothetical protein J6S60_04075 [Oscillospiraceae bacterium]|nr:hypothetical protein [Oscillospiraceae bacterium]